MIRNITIIAMLLCLCGCNKPEAGDGEKHKDEARKMAEDALLKSGGKIPPGGILPKPTKAP